MPDDDLTSPVVSDTGDAGESSAWVRTQRRLVQSGLFAATLGVVFAFGALAVLPSLLGSRAQSWAVVTLVAAGLMLVLCGIQVVAWRADGPVTGGRKRMSWTAHVLSYAVTLLALIAGLSASSAAGLGSISAGLWAFTLLLVLVAQVTAGVQYLRPIGQAPGTVPAHLRRLRAWIRASQTREDA